MPALNNDQGYSIGDDMSQLKISKSTDLKSTQVPDCGYEEKINVISSTSFIETITTDDEDWYYIKLFTQDKNDAGIHKITFTKEITNYAYADAPTPLESTVTLTILNTCLLTSISIAPSIVENLVVFAGYYAKSQFTFTYNDTMSE